VVVCYDALEWFPTPVVGFSDCLSTEGESWSAKEVSSHSLLKSSITANLASVKRSLLDHTSHCHPFLVDSSLLISVLWSWLCFEVGRSSSTCGRSNWVSARSSLAIICKLGFSQPAMSVCKSWNISSFAKDTRYLRLFGLITGSMFMHFATQCLHSCIPRPLAVVKAVDQTPAKSKMRSTRRSYSAMKSVTPSQMSLA
jgi:hypothetical protein